MRAAVKRMAGEVEEQSNHKPYGRVQVNTEHGINV